MAVRHPRPGGARALGVAAVAAAVLLAGALPERMSSAQPTPDLVRAKELYELGERAMKDGRFDDAARDYGASYEMSKDPALFFKIGRANEGAGRCTVALTYYARYLRDGKPTAQFVATTRERMRACGGDAGSGATRPDDSAGSAGSRGSAEGAGSDAGAVGSDASAAGGSGEAAPPPPPPILVPTDRHKVAWVLTGGAIALTALGSILAFAASSSENDVRDLYVGFAGQPATFDAETRKRYDNLLDQGHRFQHLSWASFGLAGAAATGAVILFVLGRREETAPHARVTPVITPRGAGVAIGF
jgi:hypothetical protein